MTGFPTSSASAEPRCQRQSLSALNWVGSSGRTTPAMLGKAAIVLATLGIAVMIGTEMLRSIVHRRRERLQGIGGTQDIAMWGTFVGLALFIAAGVCGLIWKLRH